MTSKLASLHSGLVARKGEAMPAVSHPMFSYVDTPRPAYREESSAQRRVWPPVAVQSPIDDDEPAVVQPVVETARPAIVDPVPVVEPVARTAEPEPAKPASRPAIVASTPKASATDEVEHPTRHRFTFRLTDDQHHRLRLAAAIRDESLQHLLSKALDNHLEGLCACSLKDCACLAAAQAARS